MPDAVRATRACYAKHMMKQGPALHSASVALALFFAQTARAETESVRLGYRVSQDCPPQRDFEGEVRARTNKVIFGNRGRAFEVSIEENPSGHSGRLTITEVDGQSN